MQADIVCKDNNNFLIDKEKKNKPITQMSTNKNWK